VVYKGKRTLPRQGARRQLAAADTLERGAMATLAARERERRGLRVAFGDMKGQDDATIEP
jgi:hypothetical protein